MDTRPITSERLSQSVIAVPPLARSAQLQVDPVANKAMIQFLEQGGITTLLYGGNAVFYHIALREYAETLQMLADLSGEETLVIPSFGPTFGTMLDHFGTAFGHFGITLRTRQKFWNLWQDFG